MLHSVGKDICLNLSLFLTPLTPTTQVNEREVTGQLQSQVVNMLRMVKSGESVTLVVSRQVMEEDKSSVVPRELVGGTCGGWKLMLLFQWLNLDVAIVFLISVLLRTLKWLHDQIANLCK